LSNSIYNSDSGSGDDNRVTIFLAALESTGNGLIITDPRQLDNPVVHVNQSFVERCGFSAAQMLGRNCRFLQQGDRGQASIKQIRTAIEDEQSINTSVRNYRSDGQMFIARLSIAPTHDSHGRLIGFVGIQYEEAAFEKSRRRLKELYSILSHELRTPISTITAALEIVADETYGKLNTDLRKLVTIARQGCDDFSSMMLRILEHREPYIDTTNADLEILDAAEAIYQVVSEVRPIADYRQIAIAHQSNSSELVVADRAKLCRVLITLMTMLIRQAPAESMVSIGFEKVASNRIRFFVKDECGTTSSEISLDLDHWAVMQISSTLQPADGDIYDLAICKALIELQGGELGRVTMPGKYKSYWVELNSAPRS
jgi:PAS domain S-box-containing protein